MIAADTSLGADNFPILTAIILVPAVGALMVAIVNKRRPEFVKLVAITFSVLEAALAV